MRDLVSSASTFGRPLRIAVAMAALAMLSASPNPWPSLAKSDRVASPADCRGIGATDTVDCLGVVLPVTRSEAIDVAPGLTVVDQIAG
jgi:hypothetical protein